MVGHTLRILREAKGLTRKEVASVLSIHETTYGNYELNKREPSLEIIRQLAAFYGVTTDQILGNAPLDTSVIERLSNNNKTVKSVIAIYIGRQLERLRKERGMSISDLAEVMGVSQKRISDWEEGYYPPSAEHLFVICEYFKVSMDELCGRKRNKPAALSDEQKQRNIDRFRSFTEDQQEEALRYLDYIAHSQVQDRCDSR